MARLRLLTASTAMACAATFITSSQAAGPLASRNSDAASAVRLTTLGSMSWGFYDSAAVAAYPTESAEVAAAMDQAINNYNTLAPYSGYVPVTYVTWSGVTAQASYGGSIQFGYMRSGRTAQHEMSHFMGMIPDANGGKATWSGLCPNGGWTGTQGVARMARFEPGNGVGCSASVGHFWDYGLNYDDEYNWLSKARNIAMVGALRADIGLSDGSTLPGTLYRIVSKAGGGVLADTSATDKGAAVTASSTTARNQVWTLTMNGGSAQLRNFASQRYLDGAGSTAVLAATGSSADAVSWEVIPTSSGYFMLRNWASGNCLISSGSALQLNACDTSTNAPASPAFEFHLAETALPAGMPGFGSVVSITPQSSASRRLSVDSSGLAVFANFGTTPPVASIVQAGGAYFVRRGLSDPLCVSLEAYNAPGAYLRRKQSKLYLQASDGTSSFAADATFCPADGYADAAKVTLKLAGGSLYAITESSGAAAVVPVIPGSYRSASATLSISPLWASDANAPVYAGMVNTQASLCVQLQPPNGSAYTQAQLQGCTGATQQRLRYTAAQELRDSSGNCVDALGFGTSSGTPLIGWQCTGAANQKWQLRRDGSIVGVSSGLCIDVAGTSASSGAGLQLAACAAQDKQHWQFK